MTLDPQTFLNQRFTQGADTRIPLHEPGTNFRGYVGTDPTRDIMVREATVDNEQRSVMEVWLYTDDPRATPPGGMSPTRCRYTAWLDFTPEGQLDFSKGKNRKLGLLLTATGIQARDGSMLKPDWAVSDLYGKPLLYAVIHKSRKDTGEPEAQVSQLAAVA